MKWIVSRQSEAGTEYLRHEGGDRHTWVTDRNQATEWADEAYAGWLAKKYQGQVEQA